ncbi:MAG: hypothetical protein O9972_61625 [Burkholderiales bacterium]|nr:hypothetical protein [Burkholderiales bacterium]
MKPTDTSLAGRCRSRIVRFAWVAGVWCTRCTPTLHAQPDGLSDLSHPPTRVVRNVPANLRLDLSVEWPTGNVLRSRMKFVGLDEPSLGGNGSQPNTRLERDPATGIHVTSPDATDASSTHSTYGMSTCSVELKTDSGLYRVSYDADNRSGSVAAFRCNGFDAASGDINATWIWEAAGKIAGRNRETGRRIVTMRSYLDAGDVIDSEARYVGAPQVVKTKRWGWGWVVLLTSGRNDVRTFDSAGRGRGVRFVVDVKTGQLLQQLSTGVGTMNSPAGFAQVTAYVPGAADGTVTEVCGGDLLGNARRRDFKSDTAAVPAPMLFARVRDASGNVQPLTSGPIVGATPPTRNCYVFVGTGPLLGQSDLYDVTMQTCYAFRDGTRVKAWTDTDKPAAVSFPLDRSELVAQTNLLTTIARNVWRPAGGFCDLGNVGGRVIVDPVDTDLGKISWLGSMLDELARGHRRRTVSPRIVRGTAALAGLVRLRVALALGASFGLHWSAWHAHGDGPERQASRASTRPVVAVAAAGAQPAPAAAAAPRPSAELAAVEPHGARPTARPVACVQRCPRCVSRPRAASRPRARSPSPTSSRPGRSTTRRSSSRRPTGWTRCQHSPAERSNCASRSGSTRPDGGSRWRSRRAFEDIAFMPARRDGRPVPALMRWSVALDPRARSRSASGCRIDRRVRTVGQRPGRDGQAGARRHLETAWRGGCRRALDASMPSRYPVLLDDDTCDTIAPALAGMMREPRDAVRDGLAAALCTLAAHAERMAQGRFATATLYCAALGAPFDPVLAPIAADPDGLPSLFGRPLVAGSACAVGAFGIDPVARLASGLARVLPLGTVTSARLPGIAAAVLLVAWGEAIREEGLDPAGFGALLLATPPLQTASLLTLRIATAAGLSIPPVPFAGA